MCSIPRSSGSARRLGPALTRLVGAWFPVRQYRRLSDEITGYGYKTQAHRWSLAMLSAFRGVHRQQQALGAGKHLGGATSLADRQGRSPRRGAGAHAPHRQCLSCGSRASASSPTSSHHRWAASPRGRGHRCAPSRSRRGWLWWWGRCWPCPPLGHPTGRCRWRARRRGAAG